MFLHVGQPWGIHCVKQMLDGFWDLTAIPANAPASMLSVSEKLDGKPSYLGPTISCAARKDISPVGNAYSYSSTWIGPCVAIGPNRAV